MTDAEFVPGLFVKPRRDKAPDFVKCHLSMKREEVIAWLQSREGEWVNLDVKESRGGRLYAAVDNFKPKPREEREKSGGAPLDDDIPFAPHEPRTIA